MKINMDRLVTSFRCVRLFNYILLEVVSQDCLQDVQKP